MEQQQPYPTPQPFAAAPPYGSGSASTNGLAIASLVLGISSFALVIFGPIASLPAVITGHIARRQVAHHGERGSQLAHWGLVLGYVDLGLVAFLLAFASIVFALASNHVTIAGHPLY